MLALLLSWGNNLMFFTELAFKVLPGLDKFRTVSMALVVIEWTVPLLAALGLAALWNGAEKRRTMRALAWSRVPVWCRVLGWCRVPG